MPPAGPGVDIAWLRATVARFSTGATHELRRALAGEDLDRLDPVTLRARAAAMTTHANPEGVPVDTLAAALGAPDPLSGKVSTIAASYHPGTGSGPDADAAVRALVDTFGGTADERTAAKIGLLVQANTTGTLIRNALGAVADGARTDDVPGLLAETLRYHPPVPLMRRVCVAEALDIPAGTTVLLDIAAANRDPDVFAEPDIFDPSRAEAHLTFGAGLRPCPGRDLAFALATGVLETMLASVSVAESRPRRDHV